jgi:hypothetical protein
MAAGGNTSVVPRGVTTRAELGEPREGYTGLPAAWRLALSSCPWCAATPGVSGGRSCVHCDGSGDLLGVMLLDAYRRGRDHTLAALREVEQVRKAAAARVLREEPSVRHLKSAMGLGA